ncbi:MAG: cytochrome o ubiquinol oxidase subunit [Planctomycetaceae bacterium]|nr:cytochrome o ubiquinol oxidase subunit [Planctomycetaceae bacterium]
MPSSPIERYAREPSTFARRFFWLTIVVFGAGGGLARLLVISTSPTVPPNWGHIPPAFGISSCLLFAGSLALHRALGAVRAEKAQEFRRWLVWGLIAGTLFVGIQVYGLRCLILSHQMEDASTGVNAFVVCLAALHGLHFTVALMFLIYVTIKGFAARYDHEYFWGVRVCTWFWHALGVAWLAILAVMLIAG